MTAVTAVTAQNTRGVMGIHEMPAYFVAQQMEAVISDIGLDAIKTGMLGNAAIIRAVSRIIRRYRFSRVVVDPVMVAKGGARLLAPGGEEVLRRELLPLAEVIVPNLPESEVLIGKKIRGWKGMQEAAALIQKMGAKTVLIKGGHLAGDPIDVFFNGRKFYDFKGDRLTTPHTHGTGCTISAAIATELAKGNPILDAVERAKDFVTSAIQFSLPLGHGQGPVNPWSWARRESERYGVILKLKEAFQILRGKKVGHLFPEVQSNLGYALPYARSPEDVAAFPGRLIHCGREVNKVADPEFGVSRHMARMILTAMRFDAEMRSAMNIRMGEDLITRARKAGLVIAQLDRKEEPGRGKQRRELFFSGGVEEVLRKCKTMPDVIFDRGGMGKEPMIRVLGQDPEKVVDKIIRLA
jgi:hydroxymethylpyrimidine/phosphomethylpyrimidine kinase